MNSIHFKEYVAIRFAELPTPVIENFFPKVIANSNSSITPDTLVKCAQIDWDATDEPVFTKFRAITKKTGRGDFLPTLVRFAKSEGGLDFYSILVDFASGRLIRRDPIYTDADLDAVLSKLVHDMAQAENVGKMIADRINN